jgi:hypothetical protein
MEGVAVLTAGKRLAVFSIRTDKGGSVWVRAGSAWVNKDGSMNVLLDVLPLDGKLHVREAGEKNSSTAIPTKDVAPQSAVQPIAPGAQS